ncbi:hypothetical protein HDU76_000968 [Blyttiomyces sp. JEL0837]|nr:hypothetical protein HDU76_000968 [Blyttiomyces sp. JEL0837]
MPRYDTKKKQTTEPSSLTHAHNHQQTISRNPDSDPGVVPTVNPSTSISTTSSTPIEKITRTPSKAPSITYKRKHGNGNSTTVSTTIQPQTQKDDVVLSGHTKKLNESQSSSSAMSVSKRHIPDDLRARWKNLSKKERKVIYDLARSKRRETEHHCESINGQDHQAHNLHRTFALNANRIRSLPIPSDATLAFDDVAKIYSTKPTLSGVLAKTTMEWDVEHDQANAVVPGGY